MQIRWQISVINLTWYVRNLDVQSFTAITIQKEVREEKRVCDRASGSGVFARDPDALLDLIELELPEAVLKQEKNKAICNVWRQYLDAHFQWEDDLSQDDLCSSYQMMNYCENRLDKWQMKALNRQIEESKARVQQKTAWRIEGTLREFPKFNPVNLWFHYPIHLVDATGILNDIQLEETAPPWKKGAARNKKNASDRKEERKRALEEAVDNGNFGDAPAVKDVADYLGIAERSVRDRVKEHGGYVIEDGVIHKKSQRGKD